MRTGITSYSPLPPKTLFGNSPKSPTESTGFKGFEGVITTESIIERVLTLPNNPTIEQQTEHYLQLANGYAKELKMPNVPAGLTFSSLRDEVVRLCCIVGAKQILKEQFGMETTPGIDGTLTLQEAINAYNGAFSSWNKEIDHPVNQDS